MTILNRPNDGHFNILVIIYQSIITKRDNSMKVSELINLCAPEPIKLDAVRKTLNRWIELGLITTPRGNLLGIRDENIINCDEILNIDEKYVLKDIKNLNDILKNLPKILREIIFLPENNENFWDNDNCRSADFTRALCWILSQDIFSINMNYKEYIESLINQQLPNDIRFLNDVRWNGFEDWATSLGFAWNSKTIQIDPTSAIKDYLPEIFSNNKELDIKTFLSNLNSYLPVFDRGEYRLELESKLNNVYWKRPKENHLSISLSLSLKRLESEKLIRFDRKSDYKEACSLSKRNNETWDSPITHLKYLGE